jgi:hypothetical protein
MHTHTCRNSHLHKVCTRKKPLAGFAAPFHHSALPPVPRTYKFPHPELPVCRTPPFWNATGWIHTAKVQAELKCGIGWQGRVEVKWHSRGCGFRFPGAWEGKWEPKAET